MSTMPPVITIDGPSGSGKGTISRMLARRLSWNWLDSGALYRLLALSARQAGISLNDESALERLAGEMHIEFSLEGEETRVLLNGEDVSMAIRSEACASDASRVAALPAVRKALLHLQRAFRTEPGLVADGRDMGTVVFPDAGIKIFLTASAHARAERRWKQLKVQGINASIDAITDELKARDLRDEQRKMSPLRPASDAVVVDSTDKSIPEVLSCVLDLVEKRGIHVV